MKYLACWLVLLASANSQCVAAERPNVLVILADDLGFSDLGCYGGEIRTPNLDRLAAAGLRFTQFYNSGRCWPTRAALMTGYYAQQVRRDRLPGGEGGAGGMRPAWARLLPEMLRPLGYRTYHSGKWHLDGPRLAGGFDQSYSLEDHNRFFHPQLHLRNDMRLPPVGPEVDYYATTAIADHAIECLRAHAKSDADRPFFYYLCFTSPHFPLQAPAADIARYAQAYDVGWNQIRERRWQRIQELGIVRGELSDLEPAIGPPYYFADAYEKLGPDEVSHPLQWSELNETQRRFQAQKMAIHAAMVDRMDQEIGRVLEQLRAMDAWDNTLICFLSDNGASAEIMVRGDGHDRQAAPGSEATFLCLGPGWSSASNTPFRRHKTWVHEGGIATPLIVHWPKAIGTPGQLRHTPGHVVDLVPTILAAAGAAPPNTWNGQPVPARPGRSLQAALAADVLVERDQLWWLHEGNRAIRVNNWKLVAAANEPWQLYDLSTDRTEMHDVAAEHPDQVRSLVEAWEQEVGQIRELLQP